MQSTEKSADGSPEQGRKSGGKRWKRALLSMAGGVLMAFAYPPYDLGNIVWVGLLPLLAALWLGAPQSRKFSFFLGWLYGMGWYCVSFWWIHEVGKVFGIPQWLFMAIAFVPLMAVYSCLPGLWALAAGRWLRPRHSTLSSGSSPTHTQFPISYGGYASAINTPPSKLTSARFHSPPLLFAAFSLGSPALFSLLCIPPFSPEKSLLATKKGCIPQKNAEQ